MTRTESNYVNRELSWLEFNQRVLDEALDASVPLLERLKFLAITGSNLDEFFMVRVGGLQGLDRDGSTKLDIAGLTPRQQLEAISARAHRMVDDQYDCLQRDLVPALADEGIRILGGDDLDPMQLETAERFFDEAFMVYTPMAVSSEDEFPLLATGSRNLCVRLDPAEPGGDPRYAVISFGQTAPHFVQLPSDGGHAVVPVEDAVALFVDRFFPGETIQECAAFRITRNADLGLREDMASDLLREMEAVLDARKESTCVRLELIDSASDELRGFLQRGLDVPDENLYRVPGPLDLTGFMKLSGLHGSESLRYESWSPQPSPDVDPAASIFETLSLRDVLLYQPFDSFEPVVRLLEEAAEDADVIAIKQILYRTSRDSSIVKALIRAAELGKNVTALVELKARFDEARNIEWAKDLERAGVQVIYGIKGLKTHAKICIVIRREPHGIRRYCHFGTGNYNESTSKLYTDVSYMTSNERLGADATSFFNTINGYSQLQRFRKIEAAPVGLRDRLLEAIEAEITRNRHGQQAAIMAKMNSLADRAIIDALYEASQAGVKVELIVRGICCLRPGVPGLSENISVISIIDRYLEHSRIFYFHHGGDETVYITSADCMPRNLDKRVELLVPVEDPAGKERLITILETCLEDEVKGRRILADGGYERPDPSGRRPLSSQAVLQQRAEEAVAAAERSRRMVFDPHKAPQREKM